MFELSERLSGGGRLALIGGGEFSFGETVEADLLWHRMTPDGTIGFLPTASGSADYGVHLANYLGEGCGRVVDTVPIYRDRDARREKNLDRLRECSGLYIGGGVNDQLVDVLRDSPALETIEEMLRSGKTVVAIAAAAQAVGVWMRSLLGRDQVPGLGWLRQTVIEPNFLPNHDHRLRQLVAKPGVEFGVGLPAGSCLVVSGEGVQMHGPIFILEEHDGDLKILNQHESTEEE